MMPVKDKGEGTGQLGGTQRAWGSDTYGRGKGRRWVRGDSDCCSTLRKSPPGQPRALAATRLLAEQPCVGQEGPGPRTTLCKSYSRPARGKVTHLNTAADFKEAAALDCQLMHSSQLIRKLGEFGLFTTKLLQKLFSVTPFLRREEKENVGRWRKGRDGRK